MPLPPPPPPRPGAAPTLLDAYYLLQLCERSRSIWDIIEEFNT